MLFSFLSLASCKTTRDLFYYNNSLPNLKENIKTIDEKGYSALITEKGIILGERKRQFDFEDDVKRNYNSLGNVIQEIYRKSNDSINFELTYKYWGTDTVFVSRKYFQDTVFSPYSIKFLADKYFVTQFSELFGYKTYFWKDKYSRKGRMKFSYVYENNSQAKEIYLDSKRISKYFTNSSISTSYNLDKSIWSILQKTYNLNNDDSTMSISFPKQNKNTTYSYTYEYDSKSNWTKQVQFINDTARFIIVRKIDYY